MTFVSFLNCFKHKEGHLGHNNKIIENNVFILIKCMYRFICVKSFNDYIPWLNLHLNN